MKRLVDCHDVLTPADLVSIIGASHNAVYELLQSGQIPSAKVGRKFKIARTALERWLDPANITEKDLVR